MKLVQDFTSFLKDTVNLNDTRFQLLENSIESIKAAIRGLEWEPRIRGFAAQGSWAHKTIIKPLPGSPFDADLLVYVDHVDGWDARDYINSLFALLDAHATYHGKLRRYSHCVTIEYAGDRKIDIAPCVRERTRQLTWEVCNRDSNEFEISNPIVYTDWLIARNAISGSNSFRKVTRLMKYLRDIKTNFTCPSFLLTTLLGMQVHEGDRNSAQLSDVPTTLKTIIGRLDDWLQARPNVPDVRNPVLWEEIQSNAWDDIKYANFRNKIKLYRGWIDDAFDEADQEESIGKWRRVFGEDFAYSKVTETARRVDESAAAAVASVPSLRHLDLVDLVKSLGRNALPTHFGRLPHMHRPRWRNAPGAQYNLIIRTKLYTSRGGAEVGPLRSLKPATVGRWLRFEAVNNVGVRLPDTMKVMWRVTNTGEVATRANSLRGEFYVSDEPFVRWEQLSYRGVHIVDAFVIQKSSDLLLGRSQPFYVVIE